MFFKNWPYWLKGGLLFALIYIIIVLLFILSAKFRISQTDQGAILTGVTVITGAFFLPAMFLTAFPSVMLPIFMNTCAAQDTFMMPSFIACLDVSRFYFYELIIFQLILYFVVGVTFSLLIKKLKK